MGPRVVLELGPVANRATRVLMGFNAVVGG